MKLWPKAKVRQIRFHDLRHTTASLLMMAGVNPGAVQRILRHSDPRITTETYGHHQPDYLRSEIDRLHFDTAPAEDLSGDSPPLAANSNRLLTTFLQATPGSASEGCEGIEISEESPELTSAGWTGLEPAASGVTGRRYNQLNYHPRTAGERIYMASTDVSTAERQGFSRTLSGRWAVIPCRA